MTRFRAARERVAAMVNGLYFTQVEKTFIQHSPLVEAHSLRGIRRGASRARQSRRREIVGWANVNGEEALKARNEDMPVPDSQLEKMAGLFRYWESLPGDRPRRAVDPIALGANLLPHVSLGALVDGCADFRYELISGEMSIVAPRLRPGDRSSDALRIQKTDFDLIHHLLVSTGRSIEPKVLRITFASMEELSRGIYALFLPLGRQADETGEAHARDLMIGLWRFEPMAPVTRDRFEDLFEALEAYRASRDRK
jgi:hypothetical protein